MRGQMDSDAALVVAGADRLLGTGPEVAVSLGLPDRTHNQERLRPVRAPPPGVAPACIISTPRAGLTGYRSGTFTVGPVMPFDILATKGDAKSLAKSRRASDARRHGKEPRGWRFRSSRPERPPRAWSTTEAAGKACAAAHEGAKKDKSSRHSPNKRRPLAGPPKDA